jgi:Sulfotransferase domain
MVRSGTEADSDTGEWMKIGGYGLGAMQLRRALRPVIRTVRYAGLREDDVLFGSYPKSGSTWLRFMLVDLLTGRDPEWATVGDLFPFVGGHRRLSPLLRGGRAVYTHDQATGPVTRGVYLVRDGRDVALSEYRWFVRGGYEQPFDDYLDDFIDGRSYLFGSWTSHVLYWLDSGLARSGRLHVVKFEDMRTDAWSVLKGIVDFLGLDHVAPREIDRVVRDASLEQMRAKEDRAPESVLPSWGDRFVGKGSVGGWKTRLEPQQSARLEAAMRPALVRLGYPVAARTA